MAGPRQRPPKQKIIIYKDEDSGSSVQISGGVARIRLTWALVVIVLLLVLVAVAIVLSPSREQGPAGTAARTTPVTGPAGAGTTRPVGNMPPVVRSAVIVPELPAADTTLGVSYSASDPEGDALTVEFRWYVDSVLVQSDPNSSLQPGPFHKGSTVYAEVVPADQYSAGNSFTTAPVVIANTPPSVSSVKLGPDTAYIGTMMTAAALGTDPDGDDITYTYLWRVNGNPVGKPVRENTFDTSALHKKDNVSVMVDFTDGDASGGPVISNSVVLQNRKPEITSTAPVALQGRVYTYAVAARDPDGDVLKYQLERFPDGMTIDPSSGQIRWELPKDTMFPGRNEIKVKVTVDDGDGGTDSQEFTIILTDVLTY
jgi:hypothetical protein